MTDATCYESHMRFPTDMKLLWESLEWLYRAYMPGIAGAGHKASAQQIQECGGILSVPTARKERGELQGQECLSAV